MLGGQELFLGFFCAYALNSDLFFLPVLCFGVGGGAGQLCVLFFLQSVSVFFFVVRGCGGLALPAVDECRCNMWFMDNRYSVCTF